jgi:hypothetical protein
MENTNNIKIRNLQGRVCPKLGHYNAIVNFKVKKVIKNKY